MQTNKGTWIKELAKRAEAFLFAEGAELTRRKLTSLLKCEEAELEAALKHLSKCLEETGIVLIQTETAASLAVSEESSKIVRETWKRELERDIGDAGLEVLAIVLYCGPSTRARIDYIRGVNTSSTLRNLLARGVIERLGNPEDAREYLYRPTIELLGHLGIKNVSDLPDHATITAQLAQFEKSADPFTPNNDATNST